MSATSQSLPPIVRELAWPSLGVLANAMVCAQAMGAVSKHRNKFSIKAPSIEATPDMSDQDKLKWNCVYRAQVNQLEWFALTTPLFYISSVTFYIILNDNEKTKKYGKYGPRVIGILALLFSYFRKQVKYDKNICFLLCFMNKSF